MVCLRNMSVNTLHKGDDDDDINNYKLVMELPEGTYEWRCSSTNC